MKNRSILVFLISSAVLSVSSCTKEVGPLDGLDCSNLDHTYTTGIKSIVDNKCAVSGCHVGSFQPGSFETYQGLFNKYNSGTLQIKLFDVPSMPPASMPQLTPEERQKFRCWMDAGAPNN